MRDLILPFTIGAIVVIAEAASWMWLFLRAHHGDYPVTFLGWATLIGDPVIFALLVAVLVMKLVTNRKYQGKDL